MANMKIKDGDAADVYISAEGEGTNDSPLVLKRDCAAITPRYGTDTSLCEDEAVAISTLVELGTIDCEGYNKLLLDWSLVWASGNGTGTAYIDVYPQDFASDPATYTKAMSAKRIAVAPVTGVPHTAKDFSEIDVTGLKSITLCCTGSGGAALAATVGYRLVV